jgi:putative ABC transport system permease protein
MDLAVRDLRQHAGKFAATIIGVGLLLTIVLIMNGIYRGNINDGLWLVNNTKADLWVVERDRGGPFNEQSSLPESLYRSIASVPGVRSADPFITYSVQRDLAGKSRQFTIVGYDIFGGAGGAQAIVAGRTIRQAHYEMVADQKTGLHLGDSVHLGVEDYTVVGLVKGAVDAGGNPIVYLSLHDAQQVLYQLDPQAVLQQRAALLGQLEGAGNTPTQAEHLLPLVTSQTNTINAVLVSLAPGANAKTVQSTIEDWLYFSVYTTAQERNLLLQGRLSMMDAVLGLFRSLLLIVSIVVIALMVYILTMEKIKSIATLKLLGAANGVIVRLVMEQSLLLTVASFAVGYVLVTTTQDHFPRTLFLLPSDTLVTFVVVFVGGVLASILGIVTALKAPPGLALEG